MVTSYIAIAYNLLQVSKISFFNKAAPNHDINGKWYMKNRKAALHAKQLLHIHVFIYVHK